MDWVTRSAPTTAANEHSHPSNYCCSVADAAGEIVVEVFVVVVVVVVVVVNFGAAVAVVAAAASYSCYSDYSD